MPDQRHGTLLALRQRGLVLFVASRFFAGAGMTLLRATFAWQVYEITGSAFQLGLLGLAQFVPTLTLSLLGGAVADSFDRRRVVLFAQAAALLGSAILFRTSAAGEPSLWLLYGVVVATAAASSFEGPSRAALLPTLVPRELFPSAVTLQSTVQQLGWVTGPVLMGFVIDAAGVGTAYALHVGLMVISLALLAFVRAPWTEGRSRDLSLRAIGEGIAFVRSRQAVLGAMTLDMFAVIFAGATALLPIYAEEILRVGPRGYGLLSSSLELGAFLMAAVLLVRRPIQQPGRALLLAVGAFGLATIVFGLSRSFPLSVGAFVVAGMADQVSMVTRATLIQLSTPDALRGRVSSVNLVFIGASNQLGAVESGLVAGLFGATFSVVSGGVACLAVLAWIAMRMPALRGYRVDSHGL
ncbi:MAG: MFS transporter [Myxococcota bacterium]